MSLEDTITIISKRESELTEAPEVKMPDQMMGLQNTTGSLRRSPEGVTNSPTDRHVTFQSDMLLDRDYGRIEPKPNEDIGPGANPTEYNTRQHKQLDAAAPEFYPEDTIGESTTAKEKPRMRVTFTLETCLEKIMQKQGTTREDQDRTSTATSNSQQIPGQQNRSEQ